ncbi:unnamed protein product [Cuscuta campestris]|uniref:DUF223 domain-containing protein n=1 Tax=Cuscuta campestris TaxID=132261 RepID=A0A484LTY5_9ASTE|nr:unnamed protein product [Cuscuta campestris]
MFTPISKLDNNRATWILKLRAIRVYFVPRWARGGDSMEIVFHDEHVLERGFMHISTARKKKKFESQITEDGVYAIRNVHVHDNYQSQNMSGNNVGNSWLMIFYIVKDVFLVIKV